MPRRKTSNYQLLAAIRYEIRKFLAFSKRAAREAGIEPPQHQLLPATVAALGAILSSGDRSKP